MLASIQNLLVLETTEARRAWIQQTFPQPDESFINALREESYQRERANPHLALLIAQTVVDAATVWGDPYTQAIALLIEGNARRLLGEHALAIERYAAMATICRSLSLESKAARATLGQVDSLMYLGRYQEAMQVAEWAIPVFRTANDQLGLAMMSENLGNIYARLGIYLQARHQYAQARALYIDLDDRHHLAQLSANEANVLTNLNDFLQAERLYQIARTHFENASMTSAVAQVDHNLAYLYFTQGDYQRALVTFNGARKAFAAQASTVDVAYVDLYRSEIYLELNLWQEALDVARQARAALEPAQLHWEIALLWLNEAAALVHINGYAAATQALDNAHHMFAQEHNQTWVAVSKLYQAIFDWRYHQSAQACVNALQARAIFNDIGLQNRVAQCNIVLGEIALQENDVQRAAEHFSLGLTLTNSANLAVITFPCHYGLGRVYQRQGEKLAALTHFRQAISAIERLQITIGAEDYKIAFRSDKLQVYEALILLCLDFVTAEATQEAFETVEQAKSRALLDALASEPSTQPAQAEADLLAEIEPLKCELNWYYSRLNTPQLENNEQSLEQVRFLTTAITEHEQALSRLLKRWRTPDLIAAPRNPLWTVTLPQIQAILPSGVMLLEFYMAQDQLMIFGVTRETLWTHRLSTSPSEIREALSQLHFQMNKFNYGPVYRQRHAAVLRQGADDSLHSLYKLLIQPIADKLSAETVLIVPHSLLHYVPFHALFDGEHYWLETKTIAYAPSATILHRVLTSAEPRTLEPPLLLGLADATIPHAQAEVEALASLFPHAQIRLGEQATVSSLDKNNQCPAFLHLATHATFRADNPLFSALKLADGWVNVNDIYAMSNSAPLITLSACETGRNQIGAGDELVGLCRGFFSAGAKSLVVSLWTVDDNSTARLMTHFYQALLTDQPVCCALRSAQLMMMREQAHPYYWAPFTLTGNPWLLLSVPVDTH